MTEAPGFFADRSTRSDRTLANGDGAGPRDLLSEVLRSVHLRGDCILDCAPASPFALSFDHPGGTLHILLRGEIELHLNGEPEGRRFERGDVVLLPTPLPHTVSHGPPMPPRPATASDLHSGDHPSAPADADTRWLCGTFVSDDSRAGALLAGLPPIIELRGLGGQSLVWLDVSCEMLMQEMTTPTQGSQVMISRVLDLLFIQVLRAWASQSDAEPGWLTGAMDPLVGQALSAIHANPRHAWTVAHLARKSNLSRSSFATRFASRVGQTPAAYLSELRLATAADLLLDSTESVGAIAASVGYDSDAAFSRAFSKRYGMPPSRWRGHPQADGTAN